MSGDCLGRVFSQWCKLDGPEHLSNLFKVFVGTAVHECIDDIFDTDDSSGGSEELFNQVVVGDWHSLALLILDVTSLSDQVSDQLLGGVAETDVV